jgi:hypothetical protein
MPCALMKSWKLPLSKDNSFCVYCHHALRMSNASDAHRASVRSQRLCVWSTESLPGGWFSEDYATAGSSKLLSFLMVGVGLSQ